MKKMKIQKIKLTFIIFTGLIIFSFSVFAFAEESSKNIFQDSDQDGLSNDEEKTFGTDPNNPDTDGDGYSDGIEIKSGYDPLKPAPGDKIIDENESIEKSVSEVAGTEAEAEITASKNLTDELSNQVATLLKESQTANTDIDMDDINAIIEKTISTSTTFDDLPEIDEDTIKIKKQNYSKFSEEEQEEKEKEDTLTYLTAISYVMATNSPEKLSSSDNLESLSDMIIGKVESISPESYDESFFKDLIAKEESILEQFEEIEVPENMLELHKKGLQISKYTISLKDELEINTNDPIKSILNISKINGVLSLSSNFFTEVSSSFEKLGIDEIPIEL